MKISYIYKQLYASLFPEREIWGNYKVTKKSEDSKNMYTYVQRVDGEYNYIIRPLYTKTLET